MKVTSVPGRYILNRRPLLSVLRMSDGALLYSSTIGALGAMKFAEVRNRDSVLTKPRSSVNYYTFDTSFKVVI
jgi:hypothetical protein